MFLDATTCLKANDLKEMIPPTHSKHEKKRVIYTGKMVPCSP
jgi:hypothetical protein